MTSLVPHRAGRVSTPLGRRPPVAGGLDLDLPGVGIRLRATRWPGAGVPVLLLHGLASTRRFWDLVVPRPGRAARASRSTSAGTATATARTARTTAATVGARRPDRARRPRACRGPSSSGTPGAPRRRCASPPTAPERVLAVVAVDGGLGSAAGAGGRPGRRRAPGSSRRGPRCPPSELRARAAPAGRSAPWWGPEVEAARAADLRGRRRRPGPGPAAVRAAHGASSTTCSTATRRRCSRGSPARPGWSRASRSAATPGASARPPRCERAARPARPAAAAALGAAPLHDVPLQWPALVAGLVALRPSRRSAAVSLPRRPEGVGPLHDAVLVAAFEGWNDAGDAATGAVEHLEEVWEARAVVERRPRRVLRLPGQPARRVSLVDGATRRITWPTTPVLGLPPAGRLPRRRAGPRARAEHALARRSARSCSAITRELGVETVVTLGALLADSPHTRPVPVNGTASDPATAAGAGPRAQPVRGADRHRRGLPGRLRHRPACRRCRSGRPCRTTSRRRPCPKATVALLRRVEDLLDIAGPARRPARARPAAGSGRSTSSPPRTARSPSTSPRSRSASRRPTCREASGEAIAKEFERYLRGGGDEADRTAAQPAQRRSTPSRASTSVARPAPGASASSPVGGRTRRRRRPAPRARRGRRPARRAPRPSSAVAVRAARPRPPAARQRGQPLARPRPAAPSVHSRSVR